MTQRAWLWHLVLLLLLLSLLVGCGKATSGDPFVGTWREQQVGGKLGDLPMVITRSGDGYVATFFYVGNGRTSPSPLPGDFVPLTRHGSKLVGAVDELTVEIVALPRAGRATWANSRTVGGPLDKPVDLVRVSTGTAYPTSL